MSALRLLMFGRTGQVATEVVRRAGPGVEVTALDRAQADLEDPQACARLIGEILPDVVLNAAGYTAVDRAETDSDRAHIVNGEAPGAMARACADRGLPFLHISTDYIFDGSGSDPWQTGSVARPLNAYGRSKRAGEEAVLEAWRVRYPSFERAPFAILRTSWIFSEHGTNFVKTMVRLGAERDQLDIVSDQHGAPTSAGDIAVVLLTLSRAFALNCGIGGIFHFTGNPAATWFDFASEIFAQADWIDTPGLNAIASNAYPTAARRPLNSVLDCRRLQQAYGIAQPVWRVSLREVLSALRVHPQ